MALLELPLGDRLRILQELLSCTGKMYAWCYSADGRLLGTNCPDTVLDQVFSVTGCMAAVKQHAEGHREPIMISIPYGLSWSAAFEHEDGVLKRIHVLGPAATSELSYDGISRAIQSSKIPSRWRPKLIMILQRIPVVSTIDFFRHTLMLHYTVTGEKLTNADIVFYEPALQRSERDLPVKKDRVHTYRAEQALLRMVSEGDLNYKTVLQNAASASRGVHAGKPNSLEQVRVSQIIFISLCTRAAIQGGISPEIAYSRGDAYIQDILDCRTVADAAQIGHTMYDDFIHLVHKGRSHPEYSPHIRSCCDYIELHAEEKITLSELAFHVGYADYYLSRKFKAETGMSVNDYIKTVKIERAKTMLLSGDMSIQQICERLHFGSRSFFAETFKEITGIPPAAYREEHLKV